MSLSHGLDAVRRRWHTPGVRVGVCRARADHRAAARRAGAIGAALVLLVSAGSCGGRPSSGPADYPIAGREIRHVIPWGAGGATDVAMRGIAEYAEHHLGVPIVSENVPGGLSAVGLLHVKDARPDGYTIGTMTYDVLTLEVQGLAPVSWQDFELVAMVTEHPSALIASADRWPDFGAFRTTVIAQPGRIKVGNVGTGGIWHQHAAALEAEIGGRVTHVPYEAGSGAQLAALLGGEVDASVASLPVFLPHVREGRLRVLGVMAAARDPLVTGAPTFRELGLDLVYGGFRVIVAPKGTPPGVVGHLTEAFHAAWREPSFQTWAEKAAIGAVWRDGDETRQYLEALAPRVRALMGSMGLE